MEEIIINGVNYTLSKTSKTFIKKYLDEMKYFIEKNNIESDVYDDIEERISERFNESLLKKVRKEISDKTVVAVVNEIGEPTEIFMDIINEDLVGKKEDKNFKQFFSNKNEAITRNSQEGIIAGVCYGIAKRYEIDPLWVRLGFVFGTFLWGMTIILYIALIILLPDESNSKKKVVIKKNIKKIVDEGKTTFMSLKSNIKKEEVNKKKLTPQEIKEPIKYVRSGGSSIGRNLGKLIKNIFLFIFFLIKIFIILLLIVTVIPTVAALLITSGLFFSNISFGDTELFSSIHLLLKIGIVGIIFSLTIITLGTIGKLLKGKTFSNLLIVTGVLSFLSFIFVGSIGTFNTYQNYLNGELKLQDFQVNINQLIREEDRFHFDIEGSNLDPLDIKCLNESDTPYIESISFFTGSTNGTINISGCNFNGFEGDLNAWIEDENGTKGVLFGNIDTSNKNLIEVTLTSKVCQNNMSYIGGECEKYLELIPGIYKIYTTPWGKESNKVDFVIQ